MAKLPIREFAHAEVHLHRSTDSGAKVHESEYANQELFH